MHEVYGYIVDEEIDFIKEAKAFIKREEYLPAAEMLSAFLQINPGNLLIYKKLLTLYLILDMKSCFEEALTNLSTLHPGNELVLNAIDKGLKHYPKSPVIKQLFKDNENEVNCFISGVLHA